MGDRPTRPSTDQETAPLLRDNETDDEASHPIEDRPSFKHKALAVVHDLANEPVTPLTRLLLFISLIFLLLTSIFIGLFAAAQHKLKLATHEDQPSPPDTTTVISTTTSTTTYTSTSVGSPPPVPTSAPPELPCMTPECVILAASILSSLDTTQDPCNNFYEYANGGWLAAHPLPADKAHIGSFETLMQQNQAILRRILESNSHRFNKHDQQLLDKLQGMYASCMNETQLNERGDEPLRSFVSTLRGLYSGNTTDIGEMGVEAKNNGLTAALAFLHAHGIDALFSFIIEGDSGVDPNDMLLWFYQPSLGLPSKEYYSEESIMELYQTVIEQLHHALLSNESTDSRFTFTAQDVQEDKWPPWPWPPWGPGDEDPKPLNETERIHNLTTKMIAFETVIANASMDLDLMAQDPFASYNPVSLTNITSTFPGIHFGNYFSALTPRAFPSRIILTHPPYAEALGKLLSDTEPEVLEFYLITRAALSLSPYLGMESGAWKAQRTLVEALQGIQKGAVGERSEYCVHRVEETMGMAAGRFFVEQTFAGDSKAKSTKVIESIIEAFVESLENIPWMDRTSALAAAQKAKNIRVKVGYPSSPDTKDPQSLLSYYRLVKTQPDQFFENTLSAASAATYRAWSQLGKKRNLESWEMYPSMVNAYFNPPANEIAFPAGILQDPFFSKNWPSYLSYGAFGQVAAHELTHAFDSAGRLYNQDGKLEQWWTNETSTAFNKLQKCIVDQYSAYTIDDGHGGKIHVNGNLTSGENIGDSGLIQAYRAWKAQYPASVRAGKEFLLPGLNYTREQLFFIAFGRIWARKMKSAAAVQMIRVNPHSPAKFRVEGTLSNIPEFAQAFNCPPGSKLNPPPEKQCRFWG